MLKFIYKLRKKFGKYQSFYFVCKIKSLWTVTKRVSTLTADDVLLVWWVCFQHASSAISFTSHKLWLIKVFILVTRCFSPLSVLLLYISCLSVAFISSFPFISIILSGSYMSRFHKALFEINLFSLFYF